MPKTAKQTQLIANKVLSWTQTYIIKLRTNARVYWIIFS